MLAQKLDGSLVFLNAAAFTNGRKSRLIVAFNTKQETNHPAFRYKCRMSASRTMPPARVEPTSNNGTSSAINTSRNPVVRSNCTNAGNPGKTVRPLRAFRPNRSNGHDLSVPNRP